MSLNLHAIVRNAITAVNADEDCYLIQSNGQKNVKGVLTSDYSVEPITAQIQSLNGDELKIIDPIFATDISRKFYLYSKTQSGNYPAGQVRPLGRSGDLIYRISEKTYWKIFTVSEDFSQAGWVLVFASMQIIQNVPNDIQTQINSLLS